jgi:hypothetical protein
MRALTVVAMMTACLASAETPHLAGVWKADLQKSKIPGPPVTNYLVSIEQKTGVFNMRTKEEAPEVIETTGLWGEHGEERSVLTAFDNGKPSIRSYEGVPTRITSSSSGNTFTVTGEVAGRPDHFKRTYELSADGQTLTLSIDGVSGGHPLMRLIVLNRQADASAADPLLKPEEIASAHFKNVKTDSLKNLPVSEFISQMRYYSWSLGKPCTFCHVERKFDADDKKEKKAARKMIDMVAAIDTTNFEGHPAVRCFTCHEDHAHPLTHPQFPDEIAAEAEQNAKSAPAPH